MNRYKRLGLLYCFLISMFLVGCGNSIEEEHTAINEVEETMTSEAVEESESQPEETTEEVPGKIEEKIIWDDLDGNGEQEYFIITNEENGILSVYFNNELIYQYEDQYLRIVGINGKEYIDLDHDGEEEIFVSFIPNVNSMPLVEWFVLKKGERGWELLEMYHENDDMTQNAFPISIVLKEKDFELLITCEGCDKEIIYDATDHYEQKQEEERDWNDSSYDTYVGSNFEVGDEVGSTSAWGIWNIESGAYEGRNCLIAEHGLNGPDGKFDFYGRLDVYFCYDENGKIKILDMVFREDKINIVMAEASIDFGEYKGYSIQLIMLSGQYYTKEETASAVGVYEANYDGQYILRVTDPDENLIDQLSLNEAWGLETINFPGQFELCISDYNQDGLPDFTLGTAASSGMNAFWLYSVDKTGQLTNLVQADGFVDINKDFSMYLVQEEGSTDFSTTIWNNALGEAETEYWEWNEPNGKYVRAEENRRLAFGKVLWDAYQRGILPDGSELDYVGMEAAANNSFAITDIDYDGQEELLLYWDYASMAGTVGFIFGYDNGAIHVELLEFPRFIFYDNGIVEAMWSHNQGLAGEFWPYNVYMYDAKNDVYQSYGVVDAWDKSVREENYKGDSFPTDIDVDGNGIVYYIFPADWDGQYEGVPLVDDSDYENWCSTYLDGAEQIDISFQKLTEENIAALGYPKPNIQLPQPVG